MTTTAPLRVVQWATGNIGTKSLREVIEHPGLELVGLWVHSPDKVGRDAGERGRGVMLGQPITFITEPVRRAGEIDRVGEPVRRRAAGGDGRLVEDRKPHRP